MQGWWLVSYVVLWGVVIVQGILLALLAEENASRRTGGPARRSATVGTTPDRAAPTEPEPDAS